MSYEKKKFQRGFQSLIDSTIKVTPIPEILPSSSKETVSNELRQKSPDPSPIKLESRKRTYETIVIDEDDDNNNNKEEKEEEIQLKQKPKHETHLNLDLTVIVVVRGDITERIYQAWLINLPKKLTAYNVQIRKQYSGEKDCIVIAAANCSHLTFTNWLGSQSLPESVTILSSEWIIQAIKHGTLPPYDSYRINPLAVDVKQSEKDAGEAEEEGGIDGPKRLKKKGSFTPSYACISTGEFKTLNPNKYITDILEELQQIYELCGDEWRALGYKKCIGTLKQLPRITNVEQLKGIRGVGDSIREKIKEILETGKLIKLKYFQNDPKIQSMIQLSKIWGVGEKTALKLMKQGYKTINDLRERGHAILTYQQRIGLKYYEEFFKKIPKHEIEEIVEIVKEHCSRIFSRFECQACGSYRRGKPQSGDIDILITPSPDRGGDESFRADSIVRLVQSLTEVGLLTDHLTLPEQFLSSILIKELKKKSQHDSNTSSAFSDIMALDGSTSIACRASYMGVCKLAQEGSIHRRIDIKIYPRSMYAFALLYFTGSDHFNRSMRYYAKRRGYSLSDKELVYEQRVRRFPSKHQIGEVIPCSTEEEIFEVLGLPYKAPNDRNVFDVDHLFTDQEKAEEFKLIRDHDNDEYNTSDSDH